MSEEKSDQPSANGPVVIDASTFTPTPTNVFSYRGKEYKALNILQVRRGTRNTFASIDEKLKACNTIEEQSDFLVSLIEEFVPGVPVAQLREEPWELLLQAVVRLGNSVGSKAGEARPTRGRRK